MQTPSAENLYVGAGNLYFDRFDADGKRTGLRHVGNCESLEITPNGTDLIKRSSMEGANGIYKKIRTQRGADISMVLSEYASKNLALQALGIEEPFVQASGTATDVSINDGEALNFGVWYKLTKPTTHVLGVINPTITSVKQGATVLVLNTDYEKDSESGMIRLLSSGAALSETPCTWTGTIPAITAEDGLRNVRALEADSIEGYLMYKSATDQLAGPRQQIECWKVEITSDSALQLIGTDFGTFTLKGTVLVDPTKPEGNRYYRMLNLTAQDDIEDEETA